MSGEEATVWWARVDGARAERFEAVLSPDEHARAAAFRFERDRLRFVIARGLLHTLLGNYLGADPKRIELAYGTHGKPRLADDDAVLRFNLSRSNGVVALAFCERRKIGVDVERVRADLFMDEIVHRYLPPRTVREIERRSGEERVAEFFRAWVRLEAYVKGHGGGLGLLREIAEPEGWSIVDLNLLDGYAAAVAIEGGAPARVSTREVRLETLQPRAATAPAPYRSRSRSPEG
ncbi:MAG: 4-phosphopantetheinyl transferase [Solirubrobacteraceae bacterium]|jgi:4'-phosphopantetheinyl transferase|nr:4-phosphopantetheinyl transferase [Solirubrobacteraceae bacterium]